MGKTPLLKDRLHIWASGIAMHPLMFLMIPGFNSSHPAELSLKLDIIFTTSSSLTGITQKHSYVVCWMKFRGSLFDSGIALDRLEPTLTKNLLNLFAICLGPCLTLALIGRMVRPIGMNPKVGGFKSPSGQDIYCRKNIDTFTRSFFVCRKWMLCRTQLTFPMLTLLKKYPVTVALQTPPLTVSP